MHLGLPVVGLATTEAVEAVPPDAGVLSNRLDVVERALDRFVSDREDARRTGARAREVALERFGIDRFLHDWDRLLEEVTP
jgi:glycosyltransferase involved in cell wall biosynthesis